MGIVWVTLSMALLAALAGLGRYTALAGMDPLMINFFRNFFCLIWMLPLLAWRGWDLAKTNQLSRYGVRVVLSFISMACFFQAVAAIPIGEVTAISFLSPLFGTLFAVLLLGETVRRRRWTALIIGFIGAMIMLRPGVSAIGFGQLAALISAVAVGIIGPLVKQLTAEDDADRVVFISTALLTPMSLVPALVVWEWPPASLMPHLVSLGLVAVLGHMTLVRGYMATDASLTMIFKFSRLPFSVLIGYLAFGEIIGLNTWIGALIIFVAAAYVTRREAQIAKASDTAATP